MAILQEEGAVGQLRTSAVAEPTMQLYYRYFIETLRSEMEAFVTVHVNEDGRVLKVEEQLAEVPDGEPVRDASVLTQARWDDVTEKARHEIGALLVPIMQRKREEAQAEVARTEKRLEHYYDSMKED